MIKTLFASALLFLGLAGNALAAPQEETFRDWTASLEEVNTGEDLRKTCRARVSGDDFSSRILVLGIAISDGDALPPDGYPAISLSATYPVPDGQDISVRFTSGDTRIEARASDTGKGLVVNNEKETSLALLRTMAAGSTLDVAMAGEPGPSLSLRGFTAAYRQLGIWCGFPTGDVAK